MLLHTLDTSLDKKKSLPLENSQIWDRFLIKPDEKTDLAFGT